VAFAQFSLLVCVLIYCLVQQRVYQSRVHEVEELLDICHGLKHGAVDSLIDGERVFSPEYGTKEDILSSNYSVSQKSSPPKTFCDIFTCGEPVQLKITTAVA